MSQITSPNYRKAFILVTTLFFMWGLSYGLIDVLNKHFQMTLNVSKAQSGLIQAAYFGAYFVIAIPAGLFMEWKGYKAGILCGLCLYAIGALLFVPAAGAASFHSCSPCSSSRWGSGVWKRRRIPIPPRSVRRKRRKPGSTSRSPSTASDSSPGRCSAGCCFSAATRAPGAAGWRRSG